MALHRGFHSIHRCKGNEKKASPKRIFSKNASSISFFITFAFQNNNHKKTMNMKLRNLLILAATAVMLFSCNTAKQVPYMTNIDDIPSAALASATTQAGDFTIKPGDLLLINVGSTNADAVKPFNKLQYVPTIGSGVGYNVGDMTTIYYLVDDNGNIDFPVLGKLHITGMTKKSIEEYIASLIYPRYLTEKPEVECRIQNFRVFCLGDFNSPGIIQASNGRLNLIEAIAMCHDLTLQGKRDNIMLIRTDANGQRTVKRININDASFISSPEFNLQQNDILYVQPNEIKARSAWAVPPMVSFGLSLLGTAMSVTTFILVLSDRF